MEQPAIQPFNIVLLGPPGAGKSTIAEALLEHYRLSVISTGQLLRSEIKARTSLGRTVAGIIDQGHLAPDSLMDRVLRRSLEALDDDEGILLDGYPRTQHQALGLGLTLADYERVLHAVIALDVDDDEVVRRLSGRRMCEGVGEPFPIHIDDLASMMRCRERGGRAVQREDDRPEVIQQRIQVYHEQTQPLLDYYSDEGLLKRIDADGPPATTARRVLAAIAELHQQG